MTITTTTLTRAAGLAAVAGGLLFIAVQVKHPVLDAAFTTTTEYTVRETAKIFMAVFSLIGITGIYLRQVRQTGVLGVIGYGVLALGYLAIMTGVVIGVFVLPTLAGGEPGYVNDVLGVATSRKPVGDVGPIGLLIQGGGFAYIVGGIVFGIAVFRAGILARWAAALLTIGAVATIATSQLPELVQRLFALPVSVALVGLGYSLWREQRTQADATLAGTDSSQLDPAGAR
jgi:hypothetical protein